MSLDQWRRATAFTDAGRHVTLFDGLPQDVGGLAGVVQGILLHQHIAPAYGVTLKPAQLEEPHLRGVESMLERIVSHDSSPLFEARPVAERLAGVCRHFTLMHVAMLRTQGVPARARCAALAISYGCDHLPGVDERSLAAGLALQLGIEHQGFAADHLAPMMPSGERPVCADTPISNPYREIKSALYQRARAAGADVLLTGHFGDHLQPQNGDWLASAWRHRAWRQIVERYAGLWQRGGARAIRIRKPSAATSRRPARRWECAMCCWWAPTRSTPRVT